MGAHNGIAVDIKHLQFELGLPKFELGLPEWPMLSNGKQQEQQVEEEEEDDAIFLSLSEIDAFSTNSTATARPAAVVKVEQAETRQKLQKRKRMWGNDKPNERS